MRIINLSIKLMSDVIDYINYARIEMERKEIGRAHV